MNISAISFGSVQQNNRYQRPAGHNSYNHSCNEQEYYDIFEHPNRAQQQKQPQQGKKYNNYSHDNEYRPAQKSKANHRQKLAKMMAAAFAAGMLTTAGINGCSQIVSKPQQKAVVPYNPEYSISEYAEMYDVDPEAILACNHINENHMEDVEEITIPKKYSHLQGKTDKLQEKLFSKDLSDEKRAEIENEIYQYQQKQEYLDSIATVYTDGEKIYYTIKEDINVEDFKKAFDIKDGALRDQVRYTWGEPDELGHSPKDYTTATLRKDETIVLKENKINKKINLDYMP